MIQLNLFSQCIQIQISESLIMPESYEKAVEKLSCTLSEICGVKEPCVWKKVTNFHFTENLWTDTMHDIPESICRYEILQILNILIFVSKVLIIILPLVLIHLQIFRYELMTFHGFISWD